MELKEARALLHKYNESKATKAESDLLQFWLIHEATAGQAELDEAKYAAMAAEMRGGVMGVIAPVKRKLWPRIAVAAAAVAAIAFGVYFFKGQPEINHASQVANVKTNDIAPGRNGATITRGNGQVIALDSSRSGVVVHGGLVRYASGSRSAGSGEGSEQRRTGPADITSLAPGELLVATTAKGQTYQFTLPDGTHVWLNADSKISFPSQFTGKERKIILSGEAYFAVVHNAKQPFRVESKSADGGGQVVEDIGTEFNISAYPDEQSIKTTLVEGSARVLSARDEVVLKPSQQSVNANRTLKVQTVDVNSAVDWKNGFFSLDNERLEDVMNKVARWYDVKVDYTDPALRSESFVGSFSRFENISTVIKTLERTKVLKIELKGKILYISKKK